MAISLQKPNMLGANRSFGSQRTTSASTTAAQNLSSGVRPNAFSFRNISKKSWVSGQNTIKGYNQYNYQRTRAALNPRTYTAPTVDRSSVPSYANVTYQPSSSYANGMKWGMGIAIGLGVLNTVGGMLGGNNNVSLGQQLGGAINSLGGGGGVSMAGTVTSAAAQSAITGMENATDSASLRGAITSAQSELSSLKAKDGEGTLKAEAQKAQNDMAKLDSDVKSKETALSDCNKEVETTQRDVTKYNSELTKLNGAYAEAVRDVDTKEAYVKTTEESITSAESNLAKAEALPPDDPQKAAKVREAEEKLKQAKEANEKAKTALEKAEKAKDEALEAVGEKKEEIRQAEQNLKDAKVAVKDAETARTKAQDALKESKDKYQAAKDKLTEWQTNSQDIAGLEKAIAHHQSRLTQLENSELKEYSSLGNKIEKDNAQNAKLMSKIDDDGKYTKRELRNMAKIQQNNSENEERRGRASELNSAVSDTKYIRETLFKQTPDATINGEQFRKGTLPSGQDVYYRGTTPITEEMYNEAVGLA